MQIVKDDLWLCEDCMIYACNGDITGIESDERAQEVTEGVNALGPHLVPDFDSEAEEGVLDFSARMCDGCHTHLAGSRHRFAILGSTRV